MDKAMSLQSKTTSSRGRPRDPKLHEQIIKAAGNMFSEMGLHATKMEHIARKMKISKLTLYSRFADKETLFAAVIEAKCAEFIPTKMFEELNSNDSKGSLIKICVNLMHLLLSEAAIGMERMLMALEKGEREILTQRFYQQGPERVIRLIEQHLVCLHDNHQLYVPDAKSSANLLAAMIQGADMCTRKKMHVDGSPHNEAITAYCTRAVEMFLLAHQPRAQLQ